MAHDIFISYSNGEPKDKLTANAVCATLEKHGFRCWIAPRDVLAGEDWGAAIINALNEVQALVLIFSGSANGSHQIKREVERAVHRGIPVIPFRIEDVQPSKSLEFFIMMPHWLDAMTPPLEQHLEHLASSLRVLLSGPRPMEPPPPVHQREPPPKPLPHRARSPWRVGAVLGVLVLALVGFLLLRPTPPPPSAPDKAPAFVTQALARIETADWNEAMADANQALKLDPKLAQAYAARARARTGKREYEKALADATHALELDARNSLAHVVRALVFLERHEFERGLDAAQQAVTLEPSSPWAYLVRANAHLGLKQSGKALEDYSQALELNPTFAAPYIGRSRLYLGWDQREKALDQANTACQLGPSVASAFTQRAIVKVALQDYTHAVADATEALRLDPATPEAHAWRALAHALTNDQQAALKDADEALRLDERQAVPFLVRAMVSSRRDALEQALAEANQALVLDNQLSPAYFVRGLAYAAQKKLDLAWKDFATGARLKGGDGQRALLQALLHQKAQRYAEAISVLNEAIRHEPENPKLHGMLSTLYLLKGDAGSAEAAHRKAVALDATLAQPFRGRRILVVEPGSQAERLGLRNGDILLTYGTAVLPTFSHLAALTQGAGNGSRELKVLRGQHILTFQVEPGPLGAKGWTRREGPQAREAPEER
jgi:tetratricopeptide (TPR) repeat protein